PPLFALAGYGYTVIAPDYAGFGFNASPGYFNAADEAHSILDATRAAAKILPSDRLPGQVVLVGHSQGGHAALAAHSLAPSYGLAGTLVGVATYAPFWISMLAWGAAITDAAGLQTANPGQYHLILYAMSYFYSAGELLDGPGGGVAMYPADKRSAVQQV